MRRRDDKETNDSPHSMDASTWLADAAINGLPPQLDDQAFQLVGVPNRFGIPSPFFELQVVERLSSLAI